MKFKEDMKMAKKLRVQQLLKIYRSVSKVKKEHSVCLCSNLKKKRWEIMVRTGDFIMTTGAYLYYTETAKKLRAKLLIPES